MVGKHVTSSYDNPIGIIRRAIPILAAPTAHTNMNHSMQGGYVNNLQKTPEILCVILAYHLYDSQNFIILPIWWHPMSIHGIFTAPLSFLNAISVLGRCCIVEQILCIMYFDTNSLFAQNTMLWLISHTHLYVASITHICFLIPTNNSTRQPWNIDKYISCASFVSTAEKIHPQQSPWPWSSIFMVQWTRPLHGWLNCPCISVGYYAGSLISRYYPNNYHISCNESV